jgi:hypothetical protein
MHFAAGAEGDGHDGGAGYNVCIFAYGQTGSGKTHTMAGTDVEAYEGRGINYRALDDLFALNAERQGEVCPNPLSEMTGSCDTCKFAAAVLLTVLRGARRHAWC